MSSQAYFYIQFRVNIAWCCLWTNFMTHKKLIWLCFTHCFNLLCLILILFSDSVNPKIYCFTTRKNCGYVLNARKGIANFTSQIAIQSDPRARKVLHSYPQFTLIQLWLKFMSSRMNKYQSKFLFSGRYSILPRSPGRFAFSAENSRLLPWAKYKCGS